jgi:hypothetical protein
MNASSTSLSDFPMINHQHKLRPALKVILLACYHFGVAKVHGVSNSFFMELLHIFHPNGTSLHF